MNLRPNPVGLKPYFPQGPQLVVEQLPHSEPLELVNLPPLEWLNAESSFLTFLPLQFGQLAGSFPKTSISKSLLHFSQ